MKSKATLPQLNYDNCKDCASKCEHAGKNREFVYSGERSCKVNGIARKIDREKWEPCDLCSTEMACGTCDNALSQCNHCVFTSEGKSEWKHSGTLFCRWCGHPLTEEAWAEMERRFFW